MVILLLSRSAEFTLKCFLAGLKSCISYQHYSIEGIARAALGGSELGADLAGLSPTAQALTAPSPSRAVSCMALFVFCVRVI